MIAIDTSALAAIVFAEADRARCQAALEASPDLVISAVTLAEALIVADRRDRLPEMRDLLTALEPTVIPATTETARRAAAAYARWGKGVHPARLNFADCFAYDVAKEHDFPLLYVGRDFAQTDVAAALRDPNPTPDP